MKKIQKFIVVVFIFTCIGFGLFFGRFRLLKDMKEPEIIFNKKTITASIEDSESVLKKGVKAIDDRDGDVTDSIMIESINKVKGNECEISYAAFDKTNNVAKASRKLKFEDYRPIHFNISSPLRFVLGANGDIAKVISADDCIDGDISNNIKIISEDNNSGYDGAGIYNYNIQVTNSIGDTATLPISVEFYVDSYEVRMYYPVIYLSSYVVYIEKDSHFEPKDYLQAVGVGNEIHPFEGKKNTNYTDADIVEYFGSGKKLADPVSSDRIKCQSNVDTKKQGIYTVEYSCISNDDYMGTTQLIVVVE